MAIWGDDQYRDGVDIDPGTFYRRLRERDTAPSTAQPSVGEFIDFYRRVAEEKQTDTIVGAYISTKIRGTVACAEAAAAQVPQLNITVINSLSTRQAWDLSPWQPPERRRQGDPWRRLSPRRSRCASG